MELTHAPKGSMCMSCEHFGDKECSKLPFNMMRVIEEYKGIKYVKCDNHKRAK